MRVEADHEEKGQVVGVPEGLEALSADLVVRSAVHEDHNEQHKVAGNAARLRVVNVQSNLRTDLCTWEPSAVQSWEFVEPQTYVCVRR